MIPPQDLKFFCKSHSSFKTRLGILSLYKARFPSWFEILLLTIEYLQLLSLTILIHPTVYHLSNESSLFFRFIVSLVEIVNPSYLLQFSHNDSTTNVVLVIILGYMLFKYVLIGYIIHMSRFNHSPNSFLKTIWRLVLKLQGRITCCFITSFWVRTIVMASNDSFSIQGIHNDALIAVSAVFIVFEYLMSFALETQLCDFMPSKRYLASKNFEMQIFTLLQKLAIQMIHLFAYQNITTCIWAAIILNLLISIIREYRFFRTLPLYNYKPLLYQGSLLAVVLSLNLAHLFQQILKEADYSDEIDFKFTIVLWIIIGIMSCRLSMTYIKQIYIRLLTSYQPKQDPSLLLHKIFATRYLVKTTVVPTNQTEKSDIKYIVGITQTLNLAQVFNLHQSKPVLYNIMLNRKEKTDLMREYLENLSHKFSTNTLIKLNLAYQSYKSTKFLSKIIKIISELNENISSPYQISAALLLYDLEVTNISTGQESNFLDLIGFLENKVSVQNIEKEILRQINLRKQICENIIGEKPDLEIIYQNAQIAYRSKTLIQKQIKSFLKRAPECYIDPLLVFAEYSLYLNYSTEDYDNYYDNYCRKLARYTKEFEVNNLSEQNFYQNENAFLIISAENNTIVYSTKSLQNICGFDKNNYKDTPITRLFPGCLREYSTRILKEIFEKGQMNKCIPFFLSHREGWLIEADVLIRIHPYMSRNLYLDMIIRPHSDSSDIILLDENGNVQGATQNLSPFLETQNKSAKTSLHINQISQELAALNNAFNIIKKETPSIENEKAQEIYNLYTEEQKLIELPFFQSKQKFYCKISKADFNNFSFNQIQLQSVDQKTISYKENPIADDESAEISDDLKEVDTIPPLSPSSHLPSSPTHPIFATLPTAQTKHNETEANLFAPVSPTSSRLLLKNNLLSSRLNHNVRASLSAGRAVSVASSKISQMSDMFKAFQRAISTRSYQKSFKFLCLIFYGVILLTLICQIVLKSVLDNTMSNLMIKTNLLNFAQRRTPQLCVIQNVARGCSLIIPGVLTSSDLNIAVTSLKNSMLSMVEPEEILMWSNKGIINNIASVDSEIQSILFEKSIQIKGSLADPYDSKTELVTNFQHSDMMRSAIKFLQALPFLASTAGANAFDFLIFNAANGFLVKNEQIIEAFQASVNDQKGNLQSMINLSVIALPILLAGIVFLLAVIIYKQYNKEKRHLLAFLKLNPNAIRSIIENLALFERRIIQQEKLSEKLNFKLIARLEHDPQATSYHKGHDSQKVVYSKIQMRYSFYILKIILYMSVLIAIVILNYVLITNSLDGIYRQQRQIQFANGISSTASTTYIAFAEMFATNNTNYIKGQPPFDIFRQGRKRMGEIQETVYKEFQLDNGEYDPDVKAILFEEADCNLYVASAYDNCISIKSLGLPSNMAATITLYKNMLDVKLNQFRAVDRQSFGAMIGTALMQLSYILAPFRVTSAEAERISEILSQKLVYRIDDIYQLGTTILVIFSVVLFVVSILVWFQILSKVKRVNNDFKKVLAALPPNIILSSFLLKSFLNKTSNIPQKL